MVEYRWVARRDGGNGQFVGQSLAEQGAAIRPMPNLALWITIITYINEALYSTRAISSVVDYKRELLNGPTFTPG